MMTKDNAKADDNRSPFDAAGRDLVALGFHVVPLIAQQKCPGEITKGEWHPMFDWQRFKDRQPTGFEWDVWREWDEANIGIVCGSDVRGDQIVAVDIDTFDHDETEEIIRCLPHSPMAKRGQKGMTLFYRGDAHLVTRKYDRSGRVSLCEILTGRDTRQTVVPPSIHPITGTAYTWTRGPIPAVDLPRLTVEHIEALEETLQGMGWNEFGENEPRRKEFIETGAAGWLDTPFAELNRAALNSIDNWVHDLDLYGLKKARRGYQAVNTFRESSTGQRLSDRKLNLSIQPSGISDWGSNERFSPIDLVIKALSKDFNSAFVWLHEKVYGHAPEVRLDLSPSAGLQPTVISDDEDDGVVIDATAMLGNANRRIEADQDEDELDAPLAVDDGPIDAPVFSDFVIDADLNKWRDMPPNWLIERIVEWIGDGAPKPLPALAIGAALATISVVIGRQYETPREGATSLYILCLADSGTGKNRPLGAPADMLEACGMFNLLGPSTWTAGSVLENEMKDKPNILCVTDEYADTLAKMTAYNASGAERSKMKVLKELFSVGFKLYKTQAMAQMTAVDLHAPYLSIFAAATPGGFYNALSADSIEGGFFNRWLTLYDEPDINAGLQAKAEADLAARMMGEGDDAPISAPPEAVVNGLKRLHRRRDNPLSSEISHSVRAITSAMKTKPERVFASRDAVTLYQRYMTWCSDGVRAAAPDNATFYARSAEIALRIATILAVADLVDPELDGKRITIDEDQMRWACRFVDWSTRRTVAESARRMNAGRNAGLIERIVGYMGSKKGHWVERRNLVNRFMKEVRSSRELDELLQTLVDAGRLELTQKLSRKDGRGGRKVYLFKLLKG
jgi:hypothetical protein